MKFTIKIVLGVALFLSQSVAFAQSQDGVSHVIPITPFNAEDTLRIEQISKMLPRKGGLYAVPIKNRKVWDKIAADPNFAGVIKDAEPYLKTGIPEWSDSLYTEFFRSGQRVSGEKMLEAREDCLNALVLAECLENKGRFMPLIEKGFVELLSQNSWVVPAHDYGQGNFLGHRCNVDLNAAANGANYAIAYVTLKDKLSKDIRELILRELKRHILEPLRWTMKRGGGHVWLRETTNWNAVCLTGVVTVALAIIDSPLERASYVRLAEKYSPNSIVGYPEDGYCTEGLGYYNFGFENYVYLREILHQATDGEIDLFENQKIRNIAMYPYNIEIARGVYPYNADCRWGVVASPFILNYCSRNLGLGLSDFDYVTSAALSENFSKVCLKAFPTTVTKTAPAKSGAAFKLRHYFEQSVVLITRYDHNSQCRIAAAIKGGHNAEHHNHNDVGTYSVVVGKETLVGDMGGPFAYTDLTFTDKRYILYKELSSFGHPVPFINGYEQRVGRQSEAKLIKKDFTDQSDVFVIDIASAYSPDAEIDKLERHFELNRNGKGCFTLKDEFEYNMNQSFETVLTTRSDFVIAPDNKSITFIGEQESVKVEITATDSYGINVCDIQSSHFSYKRIGIQIKNASKGYINLKYTPL